MRFFKKKKIDVKFWRAGSSVTKQGRWLTVDVHASTESVKGRQLIREAAYVMFEATGDPLSALKVIEKVASGGPISPASPRDDVDQLS